MNRILDPRWLENLSTIGQLDYHVCRWKRAISKICNLFLYFSLRKQASNNLRFPYKILVHFLICKESGRRRTGKLRSFAPEMNRTIWAFNRKYEAYGERGLTIGPMIIQAFRFEQKETNLQHILIAYPLPHRMTGKIDGVARILKRSTNQHFYNKSEPSWTWLTWNNISVKRKLAQMSQLD